MEKSNVIKELDEEREKFEQDFDQKNEGILNIKKASQWIKEASSRPIPNQLLGTLLYEQELSILFADTNVGKSILAVQLADAISKGKGMLGFKNEAEPMKVLYLDFELSDKQFEMRYSNNKGSYSFHSNFLRSEINLEFLSESEEKLEKLIIKSIEATILEQNIKVVIIDNITFLGSEMEKSKNALPLMKELQIIKKKYNITLVILAHIPKKDPSKPITKNDVAGSKMLMNFADSSIGIGRSTQDSGVRYIKQVKVRNCEEDYGANNVLICELIKEGNFLKFNFLDFDSEYNHLESFSSQVQSDKEFQQEIKMLLDENPDYSNREIAKKLDTNHQKIGRHIKKMKQSGTLV